MGAEMHALRSRHLTKDEVDASITASMTMMQRISQISGKFKIEFKTIDYLPPFTLIAFDTKEPSGRGLRSLPHVLGAQRLPGRFQLTKRNNSEWFDFFIGQFDSMWDDPQAP